MPAFRQALRHLRRLVSSSFDEAKESLVRIGLAELPDDVSNDQEADKDDECDHGPWEAIVMLVEESVEEKLKIDHEVEIYATVDHGASSKYVGICGVVCGVVRDVVSV